MSFDCHDIYIYVRVRVPSLHGFTVPDDHELGDDAVCQLTTQPMPRSMLAHP